MAKVPLDHIGPIQSALEFVLQQCVQNNLWSVTNTGRNGLQIEFVEDLWMGGLHLSVAAALCSIKNSLAIFSLFRITNNNFRSYRTCR